MIIKKKKLSDIIPADYNPRSISDKALEGLEKSISEFGLVQPLVWNKRTERLIGGHQRLKVLQKQDVTETDVIVVDLDETKEKALNITLNRLDISGIFDVDKLGNLLEEIKKFDADTFSTLDLDDFKRLMIPKELDISDFLTDEFKGDTQKKIKTFMCEHCGKESRIL